MRNILSVIEAGSKIHADMDVLQPEINGLID